MELRGEFRSVSEILDLIQIVSMGKKSGEVNFRSSEGSITLCFHQGKAVNFDSGIPTVSQIKEAAASGKLPFTEAVKLLLHYISFWNDGRFFFVEKPVSTKHLGSVDMVNTMMEFSKEVDETPEEVKKAIRNNKEFQLSEEIKEEIRIDKAGWKLLSEISKGKTLKEILFTLPYPYKVMVEKLSEFLTKGAICESSSKSVSAEENKSSVVSEDKLNKIRELLTISMGPMGEFLVDETLEELEVENLPPDMITMFIDSLIDKIPETCLMEGQSCRERFREEFEKILRGG